MNDSETTKALQEALAGTETLPPNDWQQQTWRRIQADEARTNAARSGRFRLVSGLALGLVAVAAMVLSGTMQSADSEKQRSNSAKLIAMNLESEVRELVTLLERELAMLQNQFNYALQQAADAKDEQDRMAALQSAKKAKAAVLAKRRQILRAASDRKKKKAADRRKSKACATSLDPLCGL